MPPLRPTLLHLTAMSLAAAVLAVASLAWHRDFPVWSDPLAITFEETADLGGPIVWIDARSAELYNEGHWPDAINLTDEVWDAGLPQFRSAWQPGQAVVIYCVSARCRTGHHVARRLARELGIQPRVLTGGWSTLQQHRGAAP